jgi:hypothetical protein
VATNSIIFQILLSSRNLLPGYPSPTSKSATGGMEDAKVIAIADASNLTEDATATEERRRDARRVWYAA